MNVEENKICMNCGREIARNEMAYIVDSGIICIDCDKRLQNDGSGLCKATESVGQPVAISGRGEREQGYATASYYKSGVSYHDKAARALRLGVWGAVLLFTCIGSLVGLVLILIGFSLGCVAISGMRRSGNFTGKGKAITGISLGLILYILLIIAAPVNSVFFRAEFNLFSWLVGLLFIPYLTAAIWTGLDSSELMKNITKEERNQIGGAIARSPAGWVVACTSLGPIGWQLYMAKRQDYIDFEIQKRAKQEKQRKQIKLE